VAERTRALKAACTGSYGISFPAGYLHNALDPPSHPHRARHQTARHHDPPPSWIGFGDPALSVRALEPKIANLNEQN